MKKITVFLATLVCILIITGCNSRPAEPVNTIEGNLKTYYEMSDGTWQCDEHTYQYRLEISGRMPNESKDATFVYLSNVAEISFQKAMLASGFSSNSEDYFEVKDAVLVEWE